MLKLFGHTEPRLWTKPLRELSPETSLGFEVIDFARDILRVELYPWQQWLLIHALELREDGTYRFRRIVVLVGRQNGKTTLASVLASWWLFVDSARHPERVPPLKFKVVGVAQNLDIAKEPWSAVRLWCDPKPDTAEEAELAIESLQDATAKVVDINGALGIVARSRAHYEIRAAKNARGKPAARVLMDEMREQKDWIAWNAVSQTTKSFWNGMLIGFSNAGDAASVVLSHQRDAALEDLAAWDQYVEAGVQSAEDFANGRDMSLGLFEWSAPDGCAKDDVDAILQSNPSIGHGSMTVEICLADIRGMTDAGYRTEVLCQWVSSRVDSYISVNDWKSLHAPAEAVKVPKGARTVWAVDTSHDRSTTWVSAAVVTESGVPLVTARTKRPGIIWAVKYLEELAKESGHREVAVQAKGCPAAELVEPLKKVGLLVHELEGPTCAIATGRLHDRVRDKQLTLTKQPDIDLAIEGGVVQKYAENKIWSRERSSPVDIAGLCAETWALYALEVLKPAPKKKAPPPPTAALLDDDDFTSIAPTELNLAEVAF